MKKLAGLVVVLAFLSSPAFGATCKISEYQYLVRDNAGVSVPVAEEPAVATQTVTYTTTTNSAAFNASTKFVRIICDAKAHFEFGTSAPTVTAADPYLAADTAEYFGVINGDLVGFYDGSS